MSISEKIKTIDSKIEQNKAQYNLDRKLQKILLCHLKKDLLEKAAALRRFENSP